MTMLETRILETKGNIVWRETADGIVLVDPGRGRVRVLNAVGSDIWKQILEGYDTTTIHTNIVNKYDVSAEKAAADLDLFLNELAQRELIQDV
ncbi:MAG: PqqD family protein [Anaerolineae bacterium]|nr:PqqD family protein [Anaerolineae bacterium]MCO5198158.1 PqqD family protein [Anaerolineae bacterium]